MRWTWWHFALLLAASLALSALLLWLRLPFGGFFLLLPFVFPPFLRRGRVAPADAPRECPACGFATQDPETRFCPRDGTRLAASPARPS